MVKTTCEDCLHFGACLLNLNVFEAMQNIQPEPCDKFKDKGKYLELPCKIGDTVYEIYDVEHETCSGKCRYCDTDCSSYYTCWHSTYEWKIAEYTVNLHYLFHNWNLFGSRVFLSYAEAEKAAEEKNKAEQEHEEKSF